MGGLSLPAKLSKAGARPEKKRRVCPWLNRCGGSPALNGPRERFSASCAGCKAPREGGRGLVWRRLNWRPPHHARWRASATRCTHPGFTALRRSLELCRAARAAWARPVDILPLAISLELLPLAARASEDLRITVRHAASSRCRPKPARGRRFAPCAGSGTGDCGPSLGGQRRAASDRLLRTAEWGRPWVGRAS